MTRYWTRHLLAGGALAAALVLPALFLRAGPAGAGKPSAAGPDRFCADMTNAAKAGEGFLAHPSQVAANRVTLTALIASNFLGQNAPAIMATEAQYAEMWAQDVTAMEGYHKGAVPEEAKPELKMKATIVLEKADADVTKSCPGDKKAFSALTALEKKDGRDG
jgi:hypothetical protein